MALKIPIKSLKSLKDDVEMEHIWQKETGATIIQLDQILPPKIQNSIENTNKANNKS